MKKNQHNAYKTSESHSVAADLLIVQLAVHVEIERVAHVADGEGARRLAAAAVLPDDLKLHPIILNVGVALHGGDPGRNVRLRNAVVHAVVVLVPGGGAAGAHRYLDGHRRRAVERRRALVLGHHCQLVGGFLQKKWNQYTELLDAHMLQAASSKDQTFNPAPKAKPSCDIHPTFTFSKMHATLSLCVCVCVCVCACMRACGPACMHMLSCSY